jgi:methyltransferase-like protein
VSDSPQLYDNTTEKFQTIQGITITTNHPLTKTALTILSEQRPQALSFEELWQKVCARLGETPSVPEILNRPEAREELVMALVRCFLSKSLAMHVYRPAVAQQLSERPVAIPLARHMAASGGLATNVWHFSAELNAFERNLLSLLDGTRDRQALLDHLRQHDAAKLLPISADHPAAARPEELLPAALDSCLRWIVRAGLLVG